MAISKKKNKKYEIRNLFYVFYHVQCLEKLEISAFEIICIQLIEKI